MMMQSMVTCQRMKRVGCIRQLTNTKFLAVWQVLHVFHIENMRLDKELPLQCLNKLNQLFSLFAQMQQEFEWVMIAQDFEALEPFLNKCLLINIEKTRRKQGS